MMYWYIVKWIFTFITFLLGHKNFEKPKTLKNTTFFMHVQIRAFQVTGLLQNREWGTEQWYIRRSSCNNSFVFHSFCFVSFLMKYLLLWHFHMADTYTLEKIFATLKNNIQNSPLTIQDWWSEFVFLLYFNEI